MTDELSHSHSLVPLQYSPTHGLDDESDDIDYDHQDDQDDIGHGTPEGFDPRQHSRLLHSGEGGAPVRTQPPPPPTAVCFDEPSVPAFLLKLYTMLEDPNSDDIIGWTQKGDSFVVFKPTEFSTLVLPQFFKHSNFQSFIRQLNLYGFHKLKQAPNWHEFSHHLFKRNHKHLLKDIKRKIAANTKLKKVDPKKPSLESSSRQIVTMRQTLDSVLERISKLERQNELVLRENRVLWNEVFSVNDSSKALTQQIEGTKESALRLAHIVGAVLRENIPDHGRPLHHQHHHQQMQLLQSLKTAIDDLQGGANNGMNSGSGNNEMLRSAPPHFNGGEPGSLARHHQQSHQPSPLYHQRNAVRQGGDFIEWLQDNKSHHEDQAEHLKRIDNIEARLVAGGFAVDDTDLSGYIHTPPNPSHIPPIK